MVLIKLRVVYSHKSYAYLDCLVLTNFEILQFFNVICCEFVSSFKLFTWAYINNLEIEVHFEN